MRLSHLLGKFSFPLLASLLSLGNSRLAERSVKSSRTSHSQEVVAVRRKKEKKKKKKWSTSLVPQHFRLTTSPLPPPPNSPSSRNSLLTHPSLPSRRSTQKPPPRPYQRRPYNDFFLPNNLLPAPSSTTCAYINSPQQSSHGNLHSNGCSTHSLLLSATDSSLSSAINSSSSLAPSSSSSSLDA